MTKQLKIKYYTTLSAKARAVTSRFIPSDQLSSLYENGNKGEFDSAIIHFIVNNTPWAFKDTPLEYEGIRKYIADSLEISHDNVKLVGSAKTGFSIDSTKYGNQFSDESDFDFLIVNDDIFDKVSEEFYLWKELYESDKIKPKNNNEIKYWAENAVRVPSNIDKGFIDTNKIPNIESCPVTRFINDLMYKISLNYKNRKCSVRIYKDYESFFERVCINTRAVMNSR